MARPVPPLPTITGAKLVEALRVLEEAGTLSPPQAEAVLAELGFEVAPPAAAPEPASGSAPGSAPAAAEQGRPGRSRRLLEAGRGRLGEAAAYAGAVLVAAAGAVVVAERWDALGRPGRAALLGGLTVLLAALGLFVSWPPSRTRGQHEPAARRRLASTALTAAGGTAAGAAAVLGDGSALLAAGVVAVAAMLPVQWRAPSAVSEIATLGAVSLLAGAVLDRTGSSQAAAVATYAALGGLWALLAWTPALTVPTLGLTLGLAVSICAGTAGVFAGEQPAEGIAVAVLVALAVGSLAAYARTGRWPLAGGGAIAAAVLVLRLAGGRFGLAVALLLSGVVLLGVGALLTGTRRQRHRS